MEMSFRVSIKVARGWVMIGGDDDNNKTFSGTKSSNGPMNDTRDPSQIAFEIYCKDTMQHIEWERQRMVRNGDDGCLVDFDDFPPVERDLAIEWMYLDPRSKAYYEIMAESESDTMYRKKKDVEFCHNCYYENKILQAQVLWLEPVEKESVDLAWWWSVDRRLFMACLSTLFIMTCIAFLQLPYYKI
jgi:hypothetical protein